MRVLDRCGKLFGIEVPRFVSQAEPRISEIYRVGAVMNGGTHLFEVACRT
jgi:hypothetical protein